MKGRGRSFISLGHKRADVVVRYQGGNNAGHTVIFDGKHFVLHSDSLPAFSNPAKKCLIGNGVVVDPEALREEIHFLAKRKIGVRGRLFISDAAHVILPYHRHLDCLHEDSEPAAVKSAPRDAGIGPAYSMGKVDAPWVFALADLFRTLPMFFFLWLESNLQEKAPLAGKLLASSDRLKFARGVLKVITNHFETLLNRLS